MGKESKIIIMDDDPDYASFISDVAKTVDLDCMIITNPNHFMNLFDSTVILVFLDLNIPGIDGIDLLKFIKSKGSRCGIILMSGVEDRVLESAVAFAQSMDLTIVGKFQKTIRLIELEKLLKELSFGKPALDERSVASMSSKLKVTREALMTAIQNNEFVAYYQPKINIATMDFHGVEVLIRWFNSKQELIFPDQFIPQAEQYGIIDDITWIIIKKSIKEIESLQRHTQILFKIGINLYPGTLRDLDFPAKFKQIIDKSSISPEQIIFEITESGLIKELSSALEIFTRLRLNNMQLSIDDFGTGYAMMHQLRIIPANELKIDKSFVQNMLIENSARVTVKKVIEIGHELGMNVVAEGVETEEQLQFLKAHNCDVAQGYYFSRPIKIDDLHRWINNRYGS